MEDLSRTDVAQLLGIKPGQVTRLVHAGKLPRTAGNRFLPTDVATFLQNRGEGSATPADLRLARARADKAERQLRACLLRQIPVPEATATWQAIEATITARLRRLPANAAPALAAESLAIRVEALLRDAVYAALNDIADSNTESLATAATTAALGEPPPANDAAPATAHTLAHHRNRVAAARAGMLEADERLRAGADRLHAEFTAEILQRIGNLRQALLALPVKRAPLIAVETKPESIAAILDQLIDDALAEISSRADLIT